jgi:hypothetical protein
MLPIVLGAVAGALHSYALPLSAGAQTRSPDEWNRLCASNVRRSRRWWSAVMIIEPDNSCDVLSQVIDAASGRAG